MARNNDQDSWGVGQFGMPMDGPEVSRTSWIARAIALLAALTCISLVSMVATMLVAHTARGDAEAINLSGSLRMQTYRLTALAVNPLPLQAGTIRDQYVEQFSNTLRAPALANRWARQPEHPGRQAYLSIQSDWERLLEPAITQGTLPSQALASDLVGRIDQLVTLLQRQAEQKIRWLSGIQAAALFMTLALVVFASYTLRVDVGPPLLDLLRVTREVGLGNLAARTSYRGQDELGLLSSTFNTMAARLGETQAHLQRSIHAKSAALRQANQAVQLLHAGARQLAGLSSTRDGYPSMLAQAERVLHPGRLSLCLTTANGERPYRCLNGEGQALSCADQVMHDLASTGSSSSGAARVRPNLTRISLLAQGKRYGALLIEHPQDQPPNGWQIRVCEALAGHIASLCRLSDLNRQQHRMVVMEERAAMARDLHDSLAQSLSYMKIQLTRLEAGIAPESSTQFAASVQDLREGLNIAYRQLRELLATFRLQVASDGLLPALETTVRETHERNAICIDLDYSIQNLPLEANEEIHVLQVVREAVSNVVQHADATHCWIQVQLDAAQQVWVCIDDDGTGLPSEFDAQRHHFGMAIMRERAHLLHGDLRVSASPRGGTRVELQFPPRVTAQDLSAQVST